jgi:hypothetical protein
LQSAIVRSTWLQAGTAPNMVEPVTASLPEGAAPDTLTCFGPAGSLLSTLMVAANVPVDDGWNRMGSAIDAPAATINGNVLTLGTTNSDDDDETPKTESLHGPLLWRVSDWSQCEPTQHSPNAPWSAMIVSRAPEPPRCVSFEICSDDAEEREQNEPCPPNQPILLTG